MHTVAQVETKGMKFGSYLIYLLKFQITHIFGD